MPAVRRNQSDTMLYTLITFVGISIIAAVLAIVFYIKYEQQRTLAEEKQQRISELITESQWRNRGQIIGPRKEQKTYLGTMDYYLDNMVTLIMGGPLEQTSNEQIVQSARNNVSETISESGIEYFDPNTTGLLRVIEKLNTQLTNSKQNASGLQETVNQLQKELEITKQTSIETQEKLEAEKQKYMQRAREMEQKYKELEELMNKTTKERVQAIIKERDNLSAQREETHNKLLKTQAQLRATQQRLKKIQQQLWKVKPPPDKEAPAYKPDGKVMLVDNRIVHINLGVDDQVYQGLTFSVYDKTRPISESGRGKAEIEVFDVKDYISFARIIRSETRRPIVQDDIIANLVWDSNETNVFAVAGEFDLDNDGRPDYQGAAKIEKLIKQWGGKTLDEVTINTDFLILGEPPRKPTEPTLEEREMNPNIMEEYRQALQKRRHYDKLKEKADLLWIPVINQERFLYFIGYKSLSSRPDAF